MNLSKKIWIYFTIISLCISMVKTDPIYYNIENDEESIRNETDFQKFLQTSSINATVSINAADILRELPSNAIGTGNSYVHNGSEILNPKTLDFYEGIVEKFADMGLSTIRFPGGTLGQHYTWWHGIGPKQNRPIGVNYFTGENTTNNYGIDEHFELCNQSGSKPTIIVNIETGNLTEAVNWVEYCNGEVPTSGTSGWTTNDFKGNETAPDGYFAWLRGQYGHQNPYNIINWEIGNEVYDTWTSTYNATEYGTLFNTWAAAMKAEDPNIKIAAVGYENATGYWNVSGRDTTPWNEEVARVAGANMDAINVHMYAPVAQDEKSVFFLWNFQVLRRVTIPQAGNYEILITARGHNGLGGQYPSTPQNYANLSINVDGDSEANISVEIGNPRVYNATLNFAGAGDYNIGIEMLNAETDRQAIMLGDVFLKNQDIEILIEYNNQSQLYDAIMTAGLNYRDELEELDDILETETGRTDIEIWITEYNTFYNVIGYRRNQQFEFKSAVAMADMALQFGYGGADVIQQHAALKDFFFSLIHNARSLADASMYDTYSLLIDGWGSQLLNSTVECPSFDLYNDVGWTKARNDIPYLDIMPTLSGDDLSVILVNKHPSEPINISLEILGFNSTKIGALKTINASSIHSMDYNPPDSSYQFVSGKVGNAVKLNSSLPIRYDSFNKVFPREGTVEFWIQPDWDGSDGLNHTILSIGNTFTIQQYYTGGLVVAVIDDNWQGQKIIWGITNTWNAGDWHHIAATWDINQNLTLYLDGTKAMTVPFTNFRTYFDHEQAMVIGSKPNDITDGLNGSIDELRISKVARTGAQITADYNAGVGSTPLSVNANTTILLHFDDTLEDLVVDQRTYIHTMNISYHSSGGILYLPPCSISLLEVSRFIGPSDGKSKGEDDDDDTSEQLSIPSFNLYLTIGFVGVLSIIYLKIKRKNLRKT